MKRLTKRLEDGQAAMDCILCAQQGVVCHLLSCRNRLKNRICDYEDAIQSNRLVEQKHGRWVVCGDGEYVPFMCSACGKTTSWYHAQTANYCPNCGAKMDGDGNG